MPMIEAAEKHEIITAMRKYGGHFLYNLAEALVRADGVNSRKIRENWTEEIAHVLYLQERHG